MWDSIEDEDQCNCSVRSNKSYASKSASSCCSTLNKENKNDGDLSLYGNSSPIRTSCNTVAPRCPNRRPLEDYDLNSQDSGYGTNSFSVDGDRFYNFARSVGVTPQADCSPTRTQLRSFSSMDYVEEDFFEISDFNMPEETIQLPTDFDKLLTGSLNADMEIEQISSNEVLVTRPPYRRSVSLNEGATPNSSRARSCLFKSPRDDELRPFKRPDPPNGTLSPLHSRKYRLLDNMQTRPHALLPLQRSMSATEESIKHALHRSSTEPDLIGDFSKVFCLPMTSGRHQDLKSITPTTLALLVEGHFAETVASYKVIDCRYPYEFDGGHIVGAFNLYTKEQILDTLIQNLESHKAVEDNSCTKRHILVFHCEFSSERGPALYRFLRNFDRMRNKDVYPALHYPEIYLLEGGYKNFYEQYARLCVPETYTSMLDPEHQGDLKHFRKICKACNTYSSKPSWKGGLKRLNF